MKDKIIFLVIGILIGAIITTLGFLLYTTIITRDIQEPEMGQMREDGGLQEQLDGDMEEPPEIPDDSEGQLERPDEDNNVALEDS